MASGKWDKRYNIFYKENKVSSSYDGEAIFADYHHFSCNIKTHIFDIVEMG